MQLYMVCFLIKIRACFLKNMIKFISYVNLISICLIILFKHVGNCVLNLCLDIISLIAFHVFAALNLYLSKSCSLCRIKM